MKKEIFDFSEALKRMRKGKLVKRENGLYPFGIDEEGIFYHYGHHIYKEEIMYSEDYWIKRLTTNCEVAYDVAAETYCGKVLYRPYTHVLFINGYRKDSPRIEKEICGITIGKPKKGLCPDKWFDAEFFIIKFK